MEKKENLVIINIRRGLLIQFSKVYYNCILAANIVLKIEPEVAHKTIGKTFEIMLSICAKCRVKPFIWFGSHLSHKFGFSANS